jgi:hypothetical protein
VSATKPAPFTLSQRVKTTSVQLTSEEMQLLKAKEESGEQRGTRCTFCFQPAHTHGAPAMHMNAMRRGQLTTSADAQSMLGYA